MNYISKYVIEVTTEKELTQEEESIALVDFLHRLEGYTTECPDFLSGAEMTIGRYLTYKEVENENKKLKEDIEFTKILLADFMRLIKRILTDDAEEDEVELIMKRISEYIISSKGKSNE